MLKNDVLKKATAPALAPYLHPVGKSVPGLESNATAPRLFLENMYHKGYSGIVRKVVRVE